MPDQSVNDADEEPLPSAFEPDPTSQPTTAADADPAPTTVPTFPAEPTPADETVEAAAVPLATAETARRTLVGRVPAQSLWAKLAEFERDGHFFVDEERRRVSMTEEVEPWYVGMLGERRVGGMLSRLPDEWTILHSVPVGQNGSDIDHLVIGPSGVYTINTKNHPGKKVWAAGHGMMVGGSKVPYLRNSAHEATRAAELLENATGLVVEVTPIIALTNIESLTIKSTVRFDGKLVTVTRDSQLLKRLSAQQRYSDEQLCEIIHAASRPETWSRARLADDFAGVALSERVDRLGPRAADYRLVTVGNDGHTLTRARRTAPDAVRRRHKKRADAIKACVLLGLAGVGYLVLRLLGT